MNPLISVIIPCYNRANLVGQAIESVLNQTYSHHEIIVVNDCSTDNLLEALAPYKDKIHYLDKSHNEGVSAARNDGLKIAKGEYIAFLDSDDVWLPDKSRLKMEVFAQHPDCGMVVGGCEYIDINNNSVLKPSIPDKEITYEELCIFTAIPGSTSNVLIKKVVLDKVGYFDTTLHVTEDRELWMRIAEKYRVCITKTVTVKIRIHNSPRKNREFDLMMRNRKAINRKISDPKIRRKAAAWMYYYAFSVYKGTPLVSTYLLFMSVVCYPFRIHSGLDRFRGFLEMVLPMPVYEMLSKIKHRLNI